MREWLLDRKSLASDTRYLFICYAMPIGGNGAVVTGQIEVYMAKSD